MGFMSGFSGGAGGGAALAAASTTGALVAGAAKAGAEQLQEGRTQARQDDLMQQVYANQADLGISQYNKEKANYNNLAAKKRAFIDMTGDAKIADNLIALGIDPKDRESVKAYADQMQSRGVKAGSDYQSPFDTNLQEQANASASAAQSKINRLSDKYRGNYAPVTPWQSTTAGALPDNTQQGQSSIGNQTTPSTTGIQTGPDTEIGNGAPSSGEPIPLDTSTAPSTGAAQGNQPSGSLFGANFGQKAPLTPYQQQRIDLEKQRLQQGSENNPNTQTNIDKKAQSQADVDDYKKYMHDPKTGLQARYNDIGVLSAQNENTASMVDILSNGFKASAVQPMYDEFNRFTTSVLGVDLAALGVSNKVSDVQTLKKDIANGIISKLSTLHFGRITNYEAAIVKQGFAGPGNDPNTNIKIALAMQSITSRAMNRVTAEYNAAQDPTLTNFKEKMRAGIAAQTQFDKENYSSANRAPWPQIDTNSPDAQQQAASLPPRTWWEDIAKGPGNGHMYQTPVGSQ